MGDWRSASEAGRGYLYQSFRLSKGLLTMIRLLDANLFLSLDIAKFKWAKATMDI